MKKTLLLVGGLLAISTIGSASQIFAICSEPGGQATGSSPSFSGVAVSCGNFASANGGVQLPAGWTLNDAFYVFQNDYSLGASNAATATFTWSSIVNGSTSQSPTTSYVDVVTGGLGSATYTPSGTSNYDPLVGNGSCSTNQITGNPSGGCFSAAGLAAVLGASSSFTAANVAGVGSGLQNNGSIGVAAYVFYDYSAPATGTPEPTTLALCGAALIGLGVIGRKRIRG